jgi:hypothetical protein
VNAQTIEVYIWKHIHSILSEAAGIDTIASLCNGYVLKIKMKAADLPVLQYAAGHLETLRATNPYMSDISMIGIVVDALDKLAVDLESESLAATSVAKREGPQEYRAEGGRHVIRDVRRIVAIEKLRGVHKSMLRDNDLMISH